MKRKAWDKLFHAKVIIAFLFLNKKMKFLLKTNQLCNRCVVGWFFFFSVLQISPLKGLFVYFYCPLTV